MRSLQQHGVACEAFNSNLGDNPPPEPLDYGDCALPDGRYLFIVIERTRTELDAFLDAAKRRGCASPDAPPTADYIRGDRWVIQLERGGSLSDVADRLGLPLLQLTCGK